MHPSKLIDQQIADLPGWRGQVITHLRKLIHQADPDIVEEWKWSTGTWSHNGPVCAVCAFKDHVKINFFKGATLPDPHKLLNAGLEAKHTRAIDFTENDKIDDPSLIVLIQSAVGLNTS